MSILEIAAQFPELAPVSASYLGEGCDSTALLVNGVWVFRFPKTADVEAQLAVERALLPGIAEHLPLSVPIFRYHGRPGEHFPRSFVGYPKLPGVPGITVDPGDLDGSQIEVIGRFLAALHDLPISLASASGVASVDLAAEIGALGTEAADDLAEVERVAPEAPIAAWRAMLERPPALYGGAPLVLAHNDFAAEHILIDPDTRRITGVIDWSDAAISRAEADLAGLYHWGGEVMVREVLRTYTSIRGAMSAPSLELARYLGACRGAMDVAFGIEMQRPEYVAAGLRALHLCAGSGR
jgi:aminoglycoside 2''-phosphotransferase